METEWKKRIRKPEGVYLMSLLLFLNFGVYQFYYDFSAMRQIENETPLLIAVLLSKYGRIFGSLGNLGFFRR